MKRIIEPFKIRMVGPFKLTTREERGAILRRVNFNVFQIPAEDGIIDLLTESGTAAMSSEQWAGMIREDESYAGGRNWHRCERVFRELTGMPNILPTYRRASERILFELLGRRGKTIANNNHFDTTRGNIEHSSAKTVNLVIDEGKDPRSRYPFNCGSSKRPSCCGTSPRSVNRFSVRSLKYVAYPFGAPQAQIFGDATRRCSFIANAASIEMSPRRRNPEGRWGLRAIPSSCLVADE